MSEERPTGQREIMVAHSGQLWVAASIFPWCLGVIAAGGAVAAIPVAVAHRDPRYLLMLLLAVPAIALIRPAWSGSIACRHPSKVLVEADRAIIVMPGVLPEPLVLPRRHVDSVWLARSTDIRTSRAVPNLSGFAARHYQWDPTVVVLVVTNTLLDSGKTPAFGLGVLLSNTVRYIGPRRHALLRGLVIPATDIPAAWDAFANWPIVYGDAPEEVQQWLKGPPTAIKGLRHRFRNPPGHETVLLESAPDAR